MNIKELREKIQHMPDDALVVVHGTDHEYCKASATVNTALQKGMVIIEDHGESQTPAKVFGKRIHVLVVE